MTIFFVYLFGDTVLTTESRALAASTAKSLRAVHGRAAVEVVGRS